MKPKREQAIIFSGRFDRPHLGHVETITKLGAEYAKVIVVVLSYDDQHYPMCYRLERIQGQLDRSKGKYEVVANDIHFGEITYDELLKYGGDVYGSGNIDVLRHIESLGFPCVYVPRTDEDAASNDWKYKEVERVVHGQGSRT